MSGPSIVAIGDSITLGVGDGTQEADGTQGWAALVAEALGASRYRNISDNGVRARHLLADQVPVVLAEDPDIVLGSVGGNDALRGDYDAREIERCVREAIRAMSRPGRRIVLVTIDHIGLFELLPGAVRTVMGRRADEVNRALVAAAADTDAILLNGSQMFASEGTRAWHIDRIHPSPLGHRALAQTALDLVAGDWPAVAPVPAAPRPPRLAERTWWLARKGVPWFFRRSRDLVPQFSRTVVHELLEERRLRHGVHLRA